MLLQTHTKAITSSSFTELQKHQILWFGGAAAYYRKTSIYHLYGEVNYELGMIAGRSFLDTMIGDVFIFFDIKTLMPILGIILAFLCDNL
jgi:hypothetical protein